MPFNQTKAIPEPEWNQHKDEITHLFLTGSMAILRAEMEERGFMATESQYEARLKKWGIRKNGTKDNWKIIARLVRIREHEGKRTNVYLYGKRIPTAKVKKQISRYLTTLESNNFAEEPYPQIPDGFSIETPKEDTPLLPSPTEAETTLPIRQVITANLPSSVLEQFFVSHGFSFTPERSYNLEYIDPRVLSTRILSPDREVHEQRSAILDTGTNLYNNALQLISEFRDGTFSNLHPLISTLRSLLPSAARQDFEGYPNLTLNLNGEFVNLALTRLIISSTANNFFGFHGLPDTFLECLRNPTNMRSLQELRSTNCLEADAFAENFFRAAVECSNAGIVEFFLRMNALDPNKLFFNYHGDRYTPIERAVALDSMEVTRVLIHAQADLNTTLEHSFHLPGTLGIAIGRHPHRSCVNLALVRLLLEAGAILDPDQFEKRIFDSESGARSLVLLIDYYFNASATRHIAKRILDVVLKETREDEFYDMPGRTGTRRQLNFAWNVIIGITETDFATAIKILTEEPAIPNMALYLAAEQGHLQLVRALLRSGTIPTADILTRGIKSGNEELVRYLLDAGADVSGHCSTAVVADADVDDNLFAPPRPLRHRSRTTPLAEAIRLGNDRILELLESRGAGLRIEEISQFSAALSAASEVGDIRFVRQLLDIRSVHKLLDMKPFLDGDELLGPLFASVRGSQEEIVTMILDNGATALQARVMESLERSELKDWFSGHVDSPFQQALLHASRVGHINIVRKLLGLMSIFGAGRHLCSALLASIEANQEQVTLMLLDAGFDPSLECIAKALDIKNFELVNSLLETDVFLDTTDRTREPCRHGPGSCLRPLLVLRATKLGSYSVIERIVANGADVDEFCEVSESGTALVTAVRKKDIELVRLLLDNGADIDLCASYPTGVTPLAAAVMQGDVTIADFLLARGADSADAKALCAGLLRNDSLEEKLLDAFTKQYPHGKKGFGSQLMERAIELGNLNIIRQILLLPVDLDGFVQTWEFHDMIPPSPSGRVTPLGLAIKKDQGKNLDIVQMILEAGSDPNRAVLHRYGLVETALLVAVETGNVPMVHLLVDRGASVNCRANMGVKRTPLQKAAERGSFEIVEYFLRNGADVNAPPARSGGATALQLAVIGGYIGVAELLLNSGADPNATAAKVHGRTAIEGAAEYGRVDMLRLLTNVGAKMERRQFKRATYLAERNGHVATTKYLESLFHETVSVEELLS